MKKLQQIRDKVYNLPFDVKMELFFKVNNKVLKIAQKKTEKVYAYGDYYDNLFNRFFNKEIEKFYVRTKI